MFLLLSSVCIIIINIIISITNNTYIITISNILNYIIIVYTVIFLTCIIITIIDTTF